MRFFNCLFIDPEEEKEENRTLKEWYEQYRIVLKNTKGKKEISPLEHEALDKFYKLFKNHKKEMERLGFYLEEENCNLKKR